MSDPSLTVCDEIQTKTKWFNIPVWVYSYADKVKYLFISRPESNIIKHAKRELKVIGYDINDKEEGPNKWIVENLIELLNVFSKQGHSGSSAPYCIEIFSKLASFKPLSPLTGDDSEWMYVGDGVWQNLRCSHVFKGKDGKAYDIDGKIFIEFNGSCYTSRDSTVFIDFPYTPNSEYVYIKPE